MCLSASVSRYPFARNFFLLRFSQSQRGDAAVGKVAGDQDATIHVGEPGVVMPPSIENDLSYTTMLQKTT